jgi:hypothetical protein
VLGRWVCAAAVAARPLTMRPAFPPPRTRLPPPLPAQVALATIDQCARATAEHLSAHGVPAVPGIEQHIAALSQQLGQACRDEGVPPSQQRAPRSAGSRPSSMPEGARGGGAGRTSSVSGRPGDRGGMGQAAGMAGSRRCDGGGAPAGAHTRCPLLLPMPGVNAEAAACVQQAQTKLRELLSM